MIILLILIFFIFISYHEYKNGGNINNPAYKLIFNAELTPYTPPWCENYKIIRDYTNNNIPDFGEKKQYKALAFNYMYNNTNRYNFLICNEYGNLYAALLYIHNQSITNPIILIEPTGHISPIIHHITKLPVYYYSMFKRADDTKYCKYMGKYPTEKHFTKFRGYTLINFALWFSSRNRHEVYKNAIFTAKYNEYLITQFSPPTYLCLYTAIINNTLVKIPNYPKKLVPFYFPGYTPNFLIEKPNNATHSTVFVNENLTDTAINLHLFNYCMRNNTNFDINYAKQVLNLYPKFSKYILDNFGPIPKDTKYLIVPLDMTNYTYFNGDYSLFKNINTIDILNPPLVLNENIVEEYGLLTIRRGITEFNVIAYFNCADYYPYLVGTGLFYMTYIPKALRGKPGIIQVKNIAEARYLSKNYEFITNDLDHEVLITKTVNRLLQVKIKLTPYIYTAHITGIIKILKQVYPESTIITTEKELLNINQKNITFWNIF